MEEVFSKYNTDKNASFHNYTHYYDRYIMPFRTMKSNYLEIGVFHGESLRAFREFFTDAPKIIGIDINPETIKHGDHEKGVYVEIGNQSDAQFLQDVVQKHGPFKVVLDDGSHTHHDIVASFKTLFPLLEDGGLYIIEDVICIRDQLQYFFNLTRHLNRWRRDYGGDHCVDPFKIEHKTSDPIEYSIGDIVFTNSAILIYKEVKSHWIP